MSTSPGAASGDGSARSISVFLLDDHRVFADALEVSLNVQPDLHCVAVARTLHEGLARAAAIEFDVAIIDLGLPDGSGLGIIERLLRLRPDARIIVLTAHARSDLADRALVKGADAFLGKESALGEILEAIRTCDVRRPLDADRHPGSGGRDTLTHREHEVLRHLGQAHDARRIADELGISLHTTRGHIKSVMAKLGAQSQLGAVVSASRLGLISVGSRH